MRGVGSHSRSWAGQSGWSWLPGIPVHLRGVLGGPSLGPPQATSSSTWQRLPLVCGCCPLLPRLTLGPPSSSALAVWPWPGSCPGVHGHLTPGVQPSACLGCLVRLMGRPWLCPWVRAAQVTGWTWMTLGRPASQLRDRRRAVITGSPEPAAGSGQGPEWTLGGMC